MSDCKKKKHTVKFLDNSHTPVHLEDGSNLSKYLTAANSPILFGCRVGICGTCLSELQDVCHGTLAPPTDHERDLLDVIAGKNPRARLACQINLTASITIAPLAEE